MVKAKLKYLRISPRKVRLVVDLIRGLKVVEAEKQLRFLNKRAARPILKLLKSAIANAGKNNLTKENLRIVNILVDAGPSLKRWMPRAMGRATPIMKRTSHITMILESSGSLPSAEPAKTEKIEEKPVKKERIEEKKGLLEEISQPVGRPKPVVPARPYSADSRAKKRFFSRQSLINVKKYFRRKSI